MYCDCVKLNDREQKLNPKLRSCPLNNISYKYAFLSLILIWWNKIQRTAAVPFNKKVEPFGRPFKSRVKLKVFMFNLRWIVTVLNRRYMKLAFNSAIDSKIASSLPFLFITCFVFNIFYQSAFTFNHVHFGSFPYIITSNHTLFQIWYLTLNHTIMMWPSGHDHLINSLISCVGDVIVANDSLS